MITNSNDEREPPQGAGVALHWGNISVECWGSTLKEAAEKADYFAKKLLDRLPKQHKSNDVR